MSATGCIKFFSFAGDPSSGILTVSCHFWNVFDYLPHGTAKCIKVDPPYSKSKSKSTP